MSGCVDQGLKNLSPSMWLTRKQRIQLDSELNITFQIFLPCPTSTTSAPVPGSPKLPSPESPPEVQVFIILWERIHIEVREISNINASYFLVRIFLAFYLSQRQWMGTLTKLVAGLM